MLFKLFLLLVAADGVLSCAQHENYHRHPHLGKRQIITTNPGRPQTDWRYEASFNWGLVNPSTSQSYIQTPSSTLTTENPN
jgi:hypothetical protein